MSKSFKLDGERVVYDYWERQQAHETRDPQILWYKHRKKGGVKEVGHAYVDYAAPAAVRFWTWIGAVLSCGFWAFLAYPHKHPIKDENAAAVRLDHLVNKESWLYPLFIALGLICAAMAIYYLPETCRAARAGIARPRLGLFTILAAAFGNVILAVIVVLFVTIVK